MSDRVKTERFIVFNPWKGIYFFWNIDGHNRTYASTILSHDLVLWGVCLGRLGLFAGWISQLVLLRLCRVVGRFLLWFGSWFVVLLGVFVLGFLVLALWIQWFCVVSRFLLRCFGLLWAILLCLFHLHSFVCVGLFFLWFHLTQDWAIQIPQHWYTPLVI